MMRFIKSFLSKATKTLLPQGLYESLMINRFYRWRLPEKKYQELRRRWYLKDYQGTILAIKGQRYRLHLKEAISRDFYEHEEYTTSNINSLEILAKHCKSVIDIGANIGLGSVQIGQKTQLKGLAIEPSSANFQLLQDNLRFNLKENQFLPLNLALGDKQGKRPLFLSKENSGEHRLTLHQSEDRPSEQVQVETLDSLIAQHPSLQTPYLINMDVPGYEWHLLMGAKESLKKPLAIVMKLWPLGLREAGSSISALDELCRANDLNVYLIQSHPRLQLLVLENLQAALSFIPPRWGGHADVILSNLQLDDAINLPIIKANKLSLADSSFINRIKPDEILTNNFNVFHCCVQKTASQWLRAIFTDERIRVASGLKTHYMADKVSEDVPLPERVYDEAIPPNCIITPLYLGYKSFQSLPKNDLYRCFFVMRDPRDIAVSWYYSARYSHVPIGPLGNLRNKLSNMSLDDGLILSIDHCNQTGIFGAMREWVELAAEDANVMLTRYEDLTASDNLEIFKSLFAHCIINLDDATLASILYDYRFENMSKGRSKGEEDPKNHYRKGTPEEWKNLFSSHVRDYFVQETSNLVEDLGYKW